MKQRKPDTNGFLDKLNQKTDMVPGCPILEIAGQCRVLIENHQGIIAYSTSQIMVRVQFGTYTIHGTGLKVAKMSKDQLVIQGRVDVVQLSRRC